LVTLKILIGLCLMTMGRKLFWLFVGGTGFLFGVDIATRTFTHQPGWVILATGLIIGLAGGISALFLQKILVAAAGFVAGGYVVTTMAEALRLQSEAFFWASFLVGGIAGALMVGAFFQWALILLSSFAGAMFVVQSLEFGRKTSLLLFGILLAAGIVTQLKLYLRKQN